MSEPHKTSYTLLGRALDTNDEVAWEQLCNHYRKFIYFILQDMQAPQSDIDDIAQQCLISLMSNLKKYDRTKGRFRSWFKRVIANTAIMQYRKSAAIQKKLNRYAEELDSSETSSSDTPFEYYIEKEWKRYLYDKSLERVRKHFRGQAVEVFMLFSSGKSVNEVAELTGLTPNSVQGLRNRVKKALISEIQNLSNELEN